MIYTKTECLSDVMITIGHVAQDRKDLAKETFLDAYKKIKGLFNEKIKQYIVSKYESGELEDHRSTITKLFNKKRTASVKHFNAKTLVPLFIKDTYNWVTTHPAHSIALVTFAYYAPYITGSGLFAYEFYRLFD